MAANSLASPFSQALKSDATYSYDTRSNSSAVIVDYAITLWRHSVAMAIEIRCERFPKLDELNGLVSRQKFSLVCAAFV